MSEQQRTVESAGEASPLSPHRAFVVQFRRDTGKELGYFAGRVEHMTSGQAARFQSIEELTTFLTRVLVDMTEREDR